MFTQRLDQENETLLLVRVLEESEQQASVQLPARISPFESIILNGNYNPPYSPDRFGRMYVDSKIVISVYIRPEVSNEKEG